MKQYLKRISVGAAALLGALAFGQAASAQEKTEISITRQPGSFRSMPVVTLST